MKIDTEELFDTIWAVITFPFMLLIGLPFTLMMLGMMAYYFVIATIYLLTDPISFLIEFGYSLVCDPL